MLPVFLVLSFLFSILAPSREEKIPVSFHPKELEVAMAAAREAGEVLMRYWNKRGNLEIQMKGSTPVTKADFQSNETICKKLIAAFPEYGLLTEEKIGGTLFEEAIARWREADWTWVVDPLDGTKSFIAGRKDFGIHIALMHSGIPVLGVNYYPVTKTMYIGVEGCGAYKQVKNRSFQAIHVEQKIKELRPVVSSKKSVFVQSFYSVLLGIPITQKMLRKNFKNVGSCGLRLCLIAEGNRNIYASSGESGSIWDYASGSVILREAGGFISDLHGEPLDFLSENYKFKRGTLSCGPKDLFENAIKVFEKSK